MEYQDTIAAIATPPGYSGIGVLRVSGPLSIKVARILLNIEVIKPRYAKYLPFYDNQGNVIDYGIVIFFPGPNSFTGEDIIEFQGHGSPTILDLLLQNIISIPGVRIALPGEFSERAFLNKKFDLLQIEAIDDLIHANTQNAVRLAMNSLNGRFSEFIKKISDKLTNLRIDIEKSIDFSESENEFIISDLEMNIKFKIEELVTTINQIILQAQRSDFLKDNIRIAIIGKPNVGKSSLINAIMKEKVAIVSSIPGTTRDAIQRSIFLNGIKFDIIDTAGLHFSHDKLEKASMKRTNYEIQQANHLLLVTDIHNDKLNNLDAIKSLILDNFPFNKMELDINYITIICNKSDLKDEKVGINRIDNYSIITLSAKFGYGIDLLINFLKSKIKSINNSESFLVRQRHLDALKTASKHLICSKNYLNNISTVELVAEELKLTQNSLKEIIGEFTSNDLLKKIFSKFCIGK